MAPSPKPKATTPKATPPKATPDKKADKTSKTSKSTTTTSGADPAKMHIATKAAVPGLLLLMLLWGMLRFWKCANGFAGTVFKPLAVFLVVFGLVFGTMFAPPFAKYKDALLYSLGLKKDKAAGGKANVNVVLPVMALFVVLVFVPVVWIWTRKCTDYRQLMKMKMTGNSNNNKKA